MDLKQIKEAVYEAAKQYPISRVTLFGSQADGSATEESDVDLIIEFYKPVTLITLSKLTECLERKLHKNVDVIHGPLRSTDMFLIDKEIEIYAA